MISKKMTISCGLAGLLGVAVVATTTMAAMAASPAEFYKGRKLQMIVGSDPGGGYDTYGRLVARHIGRFLSNKPGRIIVKNMPGAASIVSVNYIYNVAAQDGSIIGAPQRSVPFAQILGKKGPRYLSSKINWLGSLNNEVGVVYTWHSAKVKTMADAFKHVAIFGAVGPNDTEYYPSLLNNTMGAKFKLVMGYSSSTTIRLAMERGEVEGQTQSWSSLRNGNPEWISGKKVNVFVQLSLKKHPDLPNVPLVFDFITKENVLPQFTVEEVKTYWRLMLTEKAMGRPFMLGPKVPADRVRAMRKAFTAMVSDKAFTAEAKKRRREIVFVSGGEIQKMIGTMSAAPKKTIQNLASLIRYKGPIKRVKEALARHSGKVTKTKKGGRRIYLMFKGKEVKAKVSGSRTKFTLNGKKAKRKAIKAGMTCTFVYPGAGQEAKEVNCKK